VSPPIAYLLCDDLMWTSRITGTAQALGLQVKAVRTVDQLEQRCREQLPRCLIIDLGAANVVAADVVARVKAVCPEPPRFTAYGSHVDVATLKAARDAGCDPVLPRSKMAEELPELLRAWLG
jgi:DNA-binding NarL/FixJ family response regulator